MINGCVMKTEWSQPESGTLPPDSTYPVKDSAEGVRVGTTQSSSRCQSGIQESTEKSSRRISLTVVRCLRRSSHDPRYSDGPSVAFLDFSVPSLAFNADGTVLSVSRSVRGEGSGFRLLSCGAGATANYQFVRPECKGHAWPSRTEKPPTSFH